MFRANIGVDNGKIVNISNETQNSNSQIDASDLLIFPGFVDMHVHFIDYEPAGRHDEDFSSGTMAAASGGVTTVGVMPGDDRPVRNLRDLEREKKSAAKTAFVDYAMYGAAGTQNLERITQLRQGGIIGYKTFMTTRIAYSAGDDAALLQVLEKIAATGLKSAIHAEVGSLVDLLVRRLKGKGESKPEAHLNSRPNFVESLAIQRVVDLAHESRDAVGRIETEIGVHLSRAVGTGGGLPAAAVNGLETGFDLLHCLDSIHRAERRNVIVTV